MSNGQAVSQQFITRFAQDLLAFLRLRPGVHLESLTHSTPEMSFDLGKARKNKLIHSRAGDRIFVMSVTGIAYIRFNSITGSKYRLRLGPISSPFQKLYLENEAQAGKTLSLIIGYGAFIDFASAYQNMKLLKADDSEVNPATEEKQDTILTEVQKLSTPLSIHDTSTGAALTVSLEVGHRRFIEVWVKTSAAATFFLYGSRDNVNWRECDEIEFDGAGELKNGYFNSDKYIKVSTTDANNNEIEITAS